MAGCASIAEPFVVERATPAPTTPAAAALKELPPPQEPIVVAVYRFRDQTGQYRALENISTFSTAVTQGTTSILVRALEDSGWFVPIEREGLSNLLNERQIISGIRAQHRGPDDQELGPLPPLLYAGVILEGGVIGYDTNIITSGAGLRYFGAGGSGAVRQDQVTIYLRAVSTQTGRVLKTVHTTKTILSQRLEGGIFRYVAIRRLLEAEAGYSFNEPPVLAVTEAIEEAVRSLIVEGVRDRLWALSNPGDLTHPAFVEYDEAVAAAENTDSFGRLLQEPAARTAFGVSGGVALYQGDYHGPLARPAGSLLFRYNLTDRFGVGASIGAGQLAADRAFEAFHGQADVQGVYTLLPHRPISPYVSAGLGMLIQPDPPIPPGGSSSTGVFPYATVGGGVEMRVTPGLSILAGGSFDHALVNGLDGHRLSRINDSIFNFRAGLLYYTSF